MFIIPNAHRKANERERWKEVEKKKLQLIWECMGTLVDDSIYNSEMNKRKKNGYISTSSRLFYFIYFFFHTVVVHCCVLELLAKRRLLTDESESFSKNRDYNSFVPITCANALERRFFLSIFFFSAFFSLPDSHVANVRRRRSIYILIWYISKMTIVSEKRYIQWTVENVWEFLFYDDGYYYSSFFR